MACNSDHLKPNDAERERKHAAKLLVYLLTKLAMPIPAWAGKASVDPYGENDDLKDRDKPVRVLCETLTKMSEPEINSIVYGYNQKDPTERMFGGYLAEWWEAHQLSDARRAEEERRQQVDSAANKLTADEWKALGLPPKKTVKAPSYLASLTPKVDEVGE